jgi:hypothetical protein
MDKKFAYEHANPHVAHGNHYSTQEIEHDNTIHHFLANFDQNDYQEALDLSQINQILGI